MSGKRFSVLDAERDWAGCTNSMADAMYAAEVREIINKGIVAARDSVGNNAKTRRIVDSCLKHINDIRDKKYRGRGLPKSLFKAVDRLEMMAASPGVQVLASWNFV